MGYILRKAFSRGKGHQKSPTLSLLCTVLIWLKVGAPRERVDIVEEKLTAVTGLRYMAQLYRMSKNESLIQQSRDAVDMVVEYQGSSSGSIIADEYIGGKCPQRGCVIS